MELLLGSKSPRRKALLEKMGLTFQMVTFECDELMEGYSPEVAERLAIKKSHAYTSLKSDQMLITADTIVGIDGQILNKPKDEKQAYEMLEKLSGKTHWVTTGVCLRTLQDETSFLETTHVEFLSIPKNAMAYYIEEFKPFDKAGGYGVQDWIGLNFIRSMKGCYYNVMGLPCSKLYQALRRLKVIEE